MAWIPWMVCVCLYLRVSGFECIRVLLSLLSQLHLGVSSVGCCNGYLNTVLCISRERDSPYTTHHTLHTTETQKRTHFGEYTRPTHTRSAYTLYTLTHSHTHTPLYPSCFGEYAHITYIRTCLHTSNLPILYAHI